MREVTLFFAPHQDDEILSMGIGILESLKTDEVHVILCTDGSKSSVRKALNNKRICPFHLGIHKYDLSKIEFTNARDREFIDSCKSLGVDVDNIHIHENRTVDGELSVEKSREIVKYYLDRYKNANVRTITPFGCNKQHEDHKNLGRACLDLYEEGFISDLEFYVEPYFYKEFVDINDINIEIKKPCDEEKAKKAAASYKLWKPKEGRYAIGYHSTRKYFNAFKKEALAYMHKSIHVVKKHN